MTFKEYIKTRRVTDNPRGDFIKDMQDDIETQEACGGSFEPAMPDSFKNWRELKAYLEERNACEGAIKAAKIAWGQYRNYLSDNVH